SNIFTAFRGLLQDFTFPGAVLLSFVSGMVAAVAYGKTVAGSMRYIPLLAGYYAFVLWSPIVSILNYNSVLLALLMVTYLLEAPNATLLQTDQNFDNPSGASHRL